MKPIESLQELKDIELEIMKKIHIICEANNIRYQLCFGTLIGAIRHEGFIPWDDDIDIYMFREDYEKFRSVFPKYAKEYKLYIAASDTSPFFPRAMAKVCDERTLLIDKAFRFGDNYGVFVDIWPIDGAPDSCLFRRIHNSILLFAHCVFFAGIEKKEYFNGGIRRSVLRLISNMIGPLNIESFIEKLAKKYSPHEGGYVECYAAKIRGFEYSELYPIHLAKFEDAEFYIPDNYDSILRKIYGDYMELPPESERKPHHVIDTFWID